MIKRGLFILDYKIITKVKKRKALLVSCLIYAFSNNAVAYIDPGSASIIFQLLIAGSLGFIYVMKDRIKRLIKGISGR